MSPEFKLTLLNLTVGFGGLLITFVLILTSMACYYYSWITLMITHRAHVACAILVGLIPLVLLYRWYKYHLRGGNERCPDSISLHGKTIIITGGNTGIGKGAAVDLARRGARVIIACRSVQRAGEAVREIKAKSGSDDVLFRKLDLASFKSVREFADRILQEEERLDVLINNAGVSDAVDSGGNPALTENGLALCFQINHYGPFLLTHLLLDLLRKSAPSRVVNVTSVLHTLPKELDLAVGKGKVQYMPHFSYCLSKLANVLFTAEFSERMRGTGVTSFAVDPGFVFSSIWRKGASQFLYRLSSPFYWLLFTDEDSGANSTVYCAADDGLESGQVYFDCRKTERVHPSIDDAEMRRKLWDDSMEATGLPNQ